MSDKPLFPLGLYTEAALVVLWRVYGPIRRWVRRTWLYRRLLRGPLSDRIVFHPRDAQPRRLEDADAMLRGRFKFGAEHVDIRQGSVFDANPPSEQWARGLHSFEWLPPLAAAKGEAARTLATNLIGQWLKRHGRYSEPAWLPEVMAPRLIRLFAHSRMVLTGNDVLWRSKFFVSLREQSRMLARIADQAPRGLPRMQAASAVALSALVLDDSEKRLIEGLELLDAQIAEQIFPDGGHISRSPYDLLQAYRYLSMVIEGMGATSRPVPQNLRSAADRMAPALRFFRHGDSALALFQGGLEGEAKIISGLLSRDEVKGRPLSYARHSGYHRLAAAKTVVLFDCGVLPQPVYSTAAHAGYLAFEMSSGNQRIIVNCGAGGVRNPKWERVLRSAPAHSTGVVADTSLGSIMNGRLEDLLGPRMSGGPAVIETSRLEAGRGGSVDASHDGYQAAFALRHQRQLTLSPQGSMLTGADRFIPLERKSKERRASIPFALRFHIHPDVRVSPAHGGGVILKLPNGEGWRFRVAGGELSIEESIYLGTDTLRRTEQLVVSGAVRDTPVETGWLFELMGNV